LLELKARSFFFFPRAMDEIQTDRKRKKLNEQTAGHG
jgi:hypothetical protein